MKRIRIIFPAVLLAMMMAVSCGMLGKVGLGGHSFTFERLPQNEAELQSLAIADMKDPYAVAALTVAALTRYKTSSRDCFRMLDFLKGPESISGFEFQFLNERLKGKEYKPFSFFEGATPANNYTPGQPYRITVSSNPYSFTTDGEGHEWCTLYVTSGGADSPRPIKLRKKGSTGQWFLNDIQCLGDIRTPAADDPWN
ncbi:MAG: hypothetical protein IJL93_08390 [Bacteroidales bacterium]|nr:hypothetical protein [Bacteroidales bacterium]